MHILVEIRFSKEVSRNVNQSVYFLCWDTYKTISVPTVFTNNSVSGDLYFNLSLEVNSVLMFILFLMQNKSVVKSKNVCIFN